MPTRIGSMLASMPTKYAITITATDGAGPNASSEARERRHVERRQAGRPQRPGAEAPRATG